LQTDEDREIYMSVMQLRDQTDELQSEVEHLERTGDMRGAELYQEKLNRAQQQLMEKNKIRSVAGFVYLLNTRKTLCHVLILRLDNKAQER